ncbi:MAG TPA: MBL fold metallo-hydrolase [Pseudonocardiaceae bacterium]|jgi:glyoxylase-like metal-dependent hydrolase (beta-lactamase superfamily II)|nr:MBL fold metallo-hydrolase [Pseudonocardiaceae bacterium]
MAANPAEAGVTGIRVLGTAQHEAWQQRTLPPVERIGGGLWSIPVPIPDNPLRYTLCYLVPGDQGVVVVDPGWDHEDGWQVLCDGLATAGVSVGDVLGIIATHIHPDHHGLSGRLREASGAWVAMHPAERDNLPHRLLKGSDAGEGMATVLRAGGAPEEDITALLGPPEQRSRPAAELVLAEPDVLLEDGDLAPLPGRRLRAIWTPGHTPGHLCLQEPDARLLLTGDHVLPRITPNIGLQPGLTGDPLGKFIGSLDKVADYDDHDALPAHEYRFRGLRARAGQLQAHHEERCQELVKVVTELGAPNMWQLAENLTWSRPWRDIGRMRYAALAETASHANHLVQQGKLAFQGNQDGAVRVVPPES